MAEGLIASVANSQLDALLAAYPWVKKHTGVPGASATSNAAGDTTRKQITAGSASGGTASTTADLTWTNVSTAEDYTYLSGWTLSSGGSAGWTGGPVTANAVAVGDTFTITAGSLTWTIPVAS